MKIGVFIAFANLGIVLSSAASASEVEIKCIGSKVLSVSPATDSGINYLFVVNNPENITIQYKPVNVINPIWTQFNIQGVAYGYSDIDIINVDGLSILKNALSNIGYSITDGTMTVNIWLINYADFQFKCESINYSYQSDCQNTIIDFKGEAIPITYYGPTGRKHILSRDIHLQYSNMIWDEQRKTYLLEQKDDVLSYIDKNIYITPAVLSDTQYRLSGDCFSSYFDELIETTLGPIPSQAIAFHTDVTQLTDDDSIDNKFNNSEASLGGNAPVTLIFTAFTCPGVIHNEWQIASDSNFDDILYRFYDKEIEHTFLTTGNYYIRYIGSNSDGSCEEYSETYPVIIGESRLLAPNVFSPNNDNINDIWKIAYQSLINFECWIFDRNGHEVFRFDNPADGWDGRVNGKIVDSGIFFYVIKATGSDGKKYNLSGDINIISSKTRSNNTEF